VEILDINGKPLEHWNPGTLEPGTRNLGTRNPEPGTRNLGTRNPEPGTRNLGTRNPELDLNDYPAGIYFIRIILENQIIVKKVIKI
jgi:hypothetical protein